MTGTYRFRTWLGLILRFIVPPCPLGLAKLPSTFFWKIRGKVELPYPL